MHPIERLRFLARTDEVDAALLVREAAAALAATASDPMELLMACRRLIQRRASSGPLVWLAARMISSPDPATVAQEAVESIQRDATARKLAPAIPEGATVTVLGRPEISAAALAGRGDADVLVVDSAERLPRTGRRHAVTRHEFRTVAIHGLGPAAAASDIVLVETDALSEIGALCRPGSLAAAAVACHAGVPVWLVAGVGRCLPRPLWEAMRDHSIMTPLNPEDDTSPLIAPWDAPVEVVPLDLLDRVAGPLGLVAVKETRLRVDCPPAAELFR